MASLPQAIVNLDLAGAELNDPFFVKVVKDFHGDTLKRHPKMPLLRQFRLGVALCPLPREFSEYFNAVDASARRNYKKAKRLGYEFSLIDYNQHLDDIKEIRASAPVRQGKVDKELLMGPVTEVHNPKSKDPAHDYPIFGITKDKKLVAQASCLVAGELAMIQHILGHADYQSDGIVPFMILSMVAHIMEKHPKVRFFGYGTYYGALPKMQRFKAKFNLLPHRVKWILGEKSEKSSKWPAPLVKAAALPLNQARHQMVYRMVVNGFWAVARRKDTEFVLFKNPLVFLLYASPLLKLAGFLGYARSLVKLVTRNRFFYCVFLKDEVVATGWCSTSFCRHYPVEEGAVVVGPIWTSPEVRRRGLATFALKNAINYHHMCGHRVFYIDTSTENLASQKVIEKCGFGRPVKYLVREGSTLIQSDPNGR